MARVRISDEEKRQRRTEYMRHWRLQNWNYQSELYHNNDGKAKQRHYQLRRKYGMTMAEWNDKFEAQSNKCAVCDATEPGGGHVYWHTDHNHATKKTRGILCHKCNLALGHLSDDVSLLERMITYLKFYE